VVEVGLKVRVLLKHLPIDEKASEEIGKAFTTLARLGADKIEYADAEGFVLSFPDNLILPVDEETIKKEIGRLERLDVVVEE